MPKNYSKFFVVILILAILIVGGIYSLKGSQSKKSPALSTVSKVSSSPMPNLSGGPAKIPSLPSSPSAQQLKQYVSAVQDQAQTGNVLKIQKCTADPNDFKVKTGDSFTITNSDDKEIKLSITVNAVYTVGAKQSKTVKITAEPAIYKYSCDQTGGISNNQAGVIYITK